MTLKFHIFGIHYTLKWHKRKKIIGEEWMLLQCAERKTQLHSYINHFSSLKQCFGWMYFIFIRFFVEKKSSPRVYFRFFSFEKKNHLVHLKSIVASQQQTKNKHTKIVRSILFFPFFLFFCYTFRFFCCYIRTIYHVCKFGILLSCCCAQQIFFRIPKRTEQEKKWKKRSGKIWKIVGLNEILYFV